MLNARRAVTLLLGLAVAASVVWAIGGRVAADGTPVPPVVARWEYATAYIGEGKPVIRRQLHVTTFRPPSSSLSTGLTRRRDERGLYVEQIDPQRDHDLFALDVLGAAGWEAVSMTPSGKGHLVLLKRPVLVR